MEYGSVTVQNLLNKSGQYTDLVAPIRLVQSLRVSCFLSSSGRKGRSLTHSVSDVEAVVH